MNKDIFIGGSIKFTEERNAVKNAVIHLNNEIRDSQIVLYANTHEDFSQFSSANGHQNEYNRYIAEKADYAIFIFRDGIGEKSNEELNVALETMRRCGRPQILVLYKDGEGQSEAILRMKQTLDEYHLYSAHFSDVKHLESLVKDELKRALVSSNCIANNNFSVTQASGADSVFHIETDVDCKVLRFHKEIIVAKAGCDNEIRLPKGKHKLEFVDISDPQNVKTVTVESTGVEDFVETGLVSMNRKEVKTIDRVDCSSQKQPLKTFKNILSSFATSFEKPENDQPSSPTNRENHSLSKRGITKGDIAVGAVSAVGAAAVVGAGAAAVVGAAAAVAPGIGKWLNDQLSSSPSNSWTEEELRKHVITWVKKSVKENSDRTTLADNFQIEDSLKFYKVRTSAFVDSITKKLRGAKINVKLDDSAINNQCVTGLDVVDYIMKLIACS